MGHASKRLYSTATKLAVSTSHLKRFPPKEAIRAANSSKDSPLFDPESWAALQPPPPSALSAFAHRIGLGTVVTSPDVVRRVCTHKSFLTLHSKYYPSSPVPPTNANLATLGNALMGLFASEYIHASYPHLPTRVLKAAVSAHVGPLTCASVAQEMGAVPLLRWHRQPTTPTSPALLRSDALASIPRAMTALIYHERSLISARKFVQSFFLSREIDLRNMIKFRDPKRALTETVAKFNRDRPKSRLLKETGRYSNSPIFVVGIYSGADKLGEGFGSSLKMAEYRAAEDSLHRLYLTRTPSHILQLPSSTFPPAKGPIYQTGVESPYTPGDLGEAEIMYASGGRSSILAPKRPSFEEEEQREDDV
ncbi:ribonuclease III domain-containing protein [Hygrophoropsis aurantiaca]|uniref:Ribonuclease III domain-containing protein n=1 Tax=Hygrophoropsis aurantiaca TaxID=72124 RepID=A0ACB8A7P4_9AGAM|nr:ribonuclease III domain-containing protein [Hygrophoropsis aurantiaca]